MTVGTGLASLNIQGNAQNAQNPQQTGTTQKPTAQELEEAGRQLREAFRDNATQQQIAARAKALEAARAAAAFSQDAEATPVVVPTPPIPPSREFRIRGPNGEQTVISVPPRPFDNTIPPQAVDLAIAFFVTVAVIIIGLPLARAFARRMDRRSAAQVSPEVTSQLAHLNQAVDAIALEVERISEGQRFTTRLLSEQREAARQTLPSGADR